MELRVNGKATTWNGSGVLADLLRRYDVGDDVRGVAVALNDEVVPRSQWRHRALQPGDRIEIIHAVQGG